MFGSRQTTFELADETLPWGLADEAAPSAATLELPRSVPTRVVAPAVLAAAILAVAVSAVQRNGGALEPRPEARRQAIHAQPRIGLSRPRPSRSQSSRRKEATRRDHPRRKRNASRLGSGVARARQQAMPQPIEPARPAPTEPGEFF